MHEFSDDLVTMLLMSRASWSIDMYLDSFLFN
jgi:hypothetical protein